MLGERGCDFVGVLEEQGEPTVYRLHLENAGVLTEEETEAAGRATTSLL